MAQPVQYQQAVPQPAAYEPAPAVAVPMPESSGHISKNLAPNPVAQPPAAAPVPQQRVMAIVIPSGVEPGQTIQAKAPDGTVVQVNITLIFNYVIEC